VRLLIGDAQPVVLSGELHVAPDGTAVLRPAPGNPNRSAFRVTVARPVVVEREFGRATLECATTNLSVVGALLDEQANELRRGERVRVTITLPDEAITLTASVVCHSDDERAVRFDDDVPPGTEAALSHFLTELQRRELARRR
jgi:PilZ domain